MQSGNRLDRRTLLLGLTGSVALDSAAQASAPPHGPAPEPFSARSVDGVELSGDARGDPQAPEILFVHGLRQSRLSWDRQFADPALAGFRLVRFDLRGHGDSDKPSAASAYADADVWGADLAAVIKAAKLRRPVVVGWSLGGFVVGGHLRAYGGASIGGVHLVDAVTKLSPTC